MPYCHTLAGAFFYAAAKEQLPEKTSSRRALNSPMARADRECCMYSDTLSATSADAGTATRAECGDAKRRIVMAARDAIWSEQWSSKRW